MVLDLSSVRGVQTYSILNMGPQLFPPTLGFPTAMQQTGPSPLQILMASPQPFVPETIKVNATIGIFNEPERSVKRRKIMTLEEYKAMKAGKLYINASPEVQEQTRDDAKRKLPMLQLTPKAGVQTSSSEESTPEPDVASVPEVSLHVSVPRNTIWAHILH